MVYLCTCISASATSRAARSVAEEKLRCGAEDESAMMMICSSEADIKFDVSVLFHSIGQVSEGAFSKGFLDDFQSCGSAYSRRVFHLTQILGYLGCRNVVLACSEIIGRA